ncbi:MAG: tyrosine-type recombinase/integrase [Alphaproteobacteria bacterium]
MARRALKPTLEQTGIEKAVAMRGLRHTYASILIAQERPVPQISRYSGHADVSIMMRVHAHFLKP